MTCKGVPVVVEVIVVNPLVLYHFRTAVRTLLRDSCLSLQPGLLVITFGTLLHNRYFLGRREGMFDFLIRFPGGWVVKDVRNIKPPRQALKNRPEGSINRDFPARAVFSDVLC